MGRKPAGEVALTKAQKQARLRQRQKKEIETLRHFVQWVLDNSNEPLTRQAAMNLGFKPTYDT
jgi:hypothetical protein